MKNVERVGELDCTVICHAPNPTALVLLCHGFGAPGTDLVPIAREWIRVSPELKQVAFVFPQAPILLDPYFDSRAWWMIDVEKIQELMTTGEYRELRETIPEDLIARRAQIEYVINEFRERYSLAAEKVVVGGFSQGAMLTTEVALNYRGRLGGLIVWSGTLINETRWNNVAQGQTGISIVQSHGRTDPILPFAGAEFLRDMLLRHGHSVKFIPFDGPHTIALEAMVASMNLIKQVANAKG